MISHKVRPTVLKNECIFGFIFSGDVQVIAVCTGCREEKGISNIEMIREQQLEQWRYLLPFSNELDIWKQFEQLMFKREH